MGFKTEDKLQQMLKERFGKTIQTAEKSEIYTALLYITREEIANHPRFRVP